MKTPILFKKLSAFFSVIIVCTFVLSCIRCSPPPPEPTVSDAYKKKLITHEEALVLFNEYSKTNNKVLTESRNGNPDSRWYWFSLDEMEGYIKYVKENAKEQNLENMGIRIYMGKYPENHPAEKMASPEFGGYQTVFLMPTTKKQNSEKTIQRRQVKDENVDVETIEPMNMTNLSPPPNAATTSMN